MFVLAAQIANNTSTESPFLIIGATTLVISVVVLLWKNEAKTTI